MSDNIRDLDARHVWHPFTQARDAHFPEIVAGEGAHLIAADGARILDLVSSWWVTLHGHAHPAIARAIAEQAQRLEQVIFAEFTHAPAAMLSARIAALVPGDLNRVFFSDDGSTSVEVALKMALQYFGNCGETKRTRLVGFEGGYHGDTVGAMSVGRGSSFFRAWEGMLFPVDLVPFPATWIGDDEVDAKEHAALEALDKILSPEIAAVIIEPLIQGASGMRICRPEFLRALEARVRGAGALLICDEVMTGFGRTGALFASLKAAITPDIMCLSKGLTGGFLPMGVTVATDAVHAAFLGQGLDRAFLHGHSYTANPLGCAAALASLDLSVNEECKARIVAIERIHAERLAALASKRLGRRHRQCGTIAALDFGEGAYGDPVGAGLKQFFRARGMLLRPLGPVAYFLPPFCITETDLHRAWDTLEQAGKNL